ncbi:transposase [Phytohabitans sp. ZYX-F-186]|uniref:Transposase n=1 Tax=Phytohabitans maris TaxID=3071409 RepID=A0ABU0ZUY1_9ACTN|nr:transposase [Phytohabitans sp. ZYX-F-186]MDQ7909937.1 transposase [Phytohabitans sp. ZYX-F-186]MDQ7910134.1 transposase [Phytohabitans sp. ZYX-F-186]MDQ7910195.1 transposase [Phytohabitans sp. ZYX-F-186]MDQ7910399.1 transposase [Phytohabitans sp. ZYX-F-186]
MQGVERADRRLLDAAALVGHLVPAGSMYAFLADCRGRVFPDELFADLFPSAKGRRSIPGSVAASILTLQTLLDYSDAEAAEAARCDLRWKVACGLALDDKGFHPSTLTYWRRRLANSDRPYRVNDAVRQVVEATGILRGRRRRAVDSTILDDAVATQDTITQLIAQIRRVARVVPGAAEQIAAVCGGHDYSRPGKPDIDWDDPDAKQALVSTLVNDANNLVAALAEAKLDEPAQQAVALLALVAGQDVEPADGSDGTDGRWRIARKVAEDRVISTVDPQARHTRKSPQARRDGYRAHIAAEPDTGIITDEQLTKACGPDNADAAVAQQFLANGPTNTNSEPNSDSDSEPNTTAGVGDDDTGPEQPTGRPDQTAQEWYGDCAYGTGDLRNALDQAGHTAIIKPKPSQSPIRGGFTIDDFTVNTDQQTVTCPAAHTRPISPATRTADFGTRCRTCPLQTRCTKSKTGRKIVLNEHDALLRQARADWRTDPTLRDRYRRHRPNIERVIAQVASRGRRRLKLRYHGIHANHTWLKQRTAALNLRNLINRGLHWTNGWTLATS